MLDGPFTYNHPVRNLYSAEYKKLYNAEKEIKLIKYGSGFIGVNKRQTSLFMEQCLSIYEDIKRKDFDLDVLIGDEFITSIAAFHLVEVMKSARPYMDVYWSLNFYLTSTNYIFDKMVFLHLPDQKRSGFIYLFDYFIKKNKFPSYKQWYRILGLPKSKPPFYFIKLYIRIKNKISKVISRG